MTAADSTVLEQAVRRSAAWRLADRIVVLLSHATTSSALVRSAAAATAAVQAWNWSTQRRSIGCVLLTAALVNVALNLSQELPPAWQWLILPGVTALIGVVLLAASQGPRAN